MSQDNYRHILDDLLYTHVNNSRGFHPQHDLARNNIVAEMESYGLTVTLEPFLCAADVCGDQPYYNVVGTLRGVLRPDLEYIIGAHYDSVDNPGADDNASGVALVLEAARVLVDYDSDYTIRFVAFDREEQGLHGSKGYVAAHSNDNILGMISADMVAYNKGTNRVEIHASALFGAMRADVAEAVTTYGEGLTYELHEQSNASDQAPFQWAGIPSCLLIEDWGNPNYHQYTDSVDTPDYIDYGFATRVTRSVVGFLVDHAGTHVPLDCNSNGQDDLIDIADGVSRDCDLNSIPDECDPDCDASGFPDTCELAGQFVARSQELAPLYFGSWQSYTISAPPPAASDVVLSFAASADLGAQDEYVSITLNNNLLPEGDIFVDGASDCSDPADSAVLVVPAGEFKRIVGDGAAVIRMIPSPAVDRPTCGLSAYISVNVTYQTVGSPDCNGNLIPDYCEEPGDIDGDGRRTLMDYSSGTPCITGPCTQPPCKPLLYADACCAILDGDSDGDVDLADLGTFMLGAAPP
ncbi:MAG: M28 family metallopeptidase [Phycisphaerae bacterium]